MLKNDPNEGIKCNICHGRGFVIKDEVAHRCSCSKQRSLKALVRHANLGRLQQRCSFEDFSFAYYPKVMDKELGFTYYENAQKALDAAKKFASAFAAGNYHGPGLVFTGPVGSGKTFLAGAIANYVLVRGRQVLFTVVPDLLDEIKATYHRHNPNPVDETTILEGARTVELLILDDLGVHNYTEWTVNKIYSILNYRANYQLPVVITTNLSLAELDTYLGERTTSRILQLCRVYRLASIQDIRYLKSKEHSLE
ncbi:MAG: ATP-binding protein [Clostridia bacterium]|nr:ATP-binding protein [Clostridia bacterium]